MSTYTDLHNRVKENVTIDYHNRITPQKVKLFNEENEYWGTFQGVISGANSVMSGGSIVSATLSDVSFVGNVELPGLEGVTVEQLTSTINTLSTRLDEVQYTELTTLNNNIESEASIRKHDDEVLCAEFRNVSSYVNQVSANIITAGLDVATEKLSNDLTGIINSVSSTLDSNDRQICTDLSTEISSLDIRINKKVDQICANLSTDVDQICVNISTDVQQKYVELTNIDSQLSGHISAEIEDRIIGDNTLNESITAKYDEFKAHVRNNENEFADTRKDLCATIEHERHYGYNNTFDRYPYMLHDYDVNSIQVEIADGKIFYNSNIQIGIVIDHGDTYTFKFNNIFNAPTFPNAVVNNAIFAGIKKNEDANVKYDNSNLINGYSLYWTCATSTITLSTDNIVEKLVKNGSETIGNIINYTTERISDPTSKITSGQLEIVTKDTAFANFILPKTKIKFNNTDLSTLEYSIDNSSKQKIRITYWFDDQILWLEDNIKTINYVPLSSDKTQQVYGRVQQQDVSYINNSATNGISSITVKLYNVDNDKLTTSYILNTANHFMSQVSDSEILCADIHNSSAKFYSIRSNIKWQYELIAGVDPTASKHVGNIIIGNENTVIDDITNITSMSVIFDDDGEPATLLPENFSIVLMKKDGTNTLTAEYTNDEQDLTLSFKYDLRTYQLTLFGNSSAGSIIDWKYVINRAIKTISNSSDAYQTIWDTPEIELNSTSFTSSAELPGTMYIVSIANYQLNSNSQNIELKVDYSPQNNIQFIVPTIADSDVSREFMLVGQFITDRATLSSIPLLFTNKDGNFLEIINHDVLEQTPNVKNDVVVATNRLVTYAFKEITKNRFMAINCDHQDAQYILNKLNSEIATRIEDDNYLSGRIDQEIADRIEAVEDLSSALSGEIDQEIADRIKAVADLSTSLSNTVDELTGFISSEISTVSTDLDELEDHYYTNMSVDVEISALSTDYIGGTHTVFAAVDQLLIADEKTYDLYRLTIRNGALNINKVGDISARFEHKPLKN